MSEINKLVDQELENVSGGEYRVVNTGDSRNAAIRSLPGLNTSIIGSLPNGTWANTTGRFIRVDGRNWAEINSPMYGWIKGSILGYEY
ncbi:MAG: hypothetical protein Q4E45_01130 [Eubacteriales bacterium]|nr:hypothetical protein [Eubacteriales bacterium]